MVPITELLLPVVLSAVAVFIVSSIIHMVLTYHQTDYLPVPDEGGLLADLRRARLTPGDYAVPYARTPKELSSPEYVAKVTQGPVAFITVAPSGRHALGRMLVQWFLYSLAISTVAAYVASRALGEGADYLSVFRFTGTTAFVAYVFGLWHQSIWYYRSWSTTFKESFDGLVYALVTAGVFGWLWP